MTTTVVRRARGAKSPAPDDSSGALAAQLVETDLGWMVLVGREGRLARLGFDLPSEQAARKLMSEQGAVPREWNPRLARRLRDYAAGLHGDFGDVPLDLEGLAPFTRRVIAACRDVAYGKTSNYAGLATQAGSPRAARAVGNVMRANRWPIIVPRHRILAAGDKLGGYSAPSGLLLKKRLLAMEASASARRGRA